MDAHGTVVHTRTCNERTRGLSRQMAKKAGVGATPKEAPSDAAGDMGYLVLRTAPGLEHLRGIHKVSWTVLWRRFGMSPDQDRKSFHILNAADDITNQQHWAGQKLLGTPPVHP